MGLKDLLEPVCNCREAEKGSLVHLVNSIKNCKRLFADIAGVGVEFPQETDLMKTRVAINNIYLTSRFRIRHRQALGGFGRFDPKKLD
jgi:hypothetical protein